MRVAIVHDDLVQWGGAEKVLLAISEIFPEAPIYTSVFDRTNSLLWRNFGTKKIITSFMQKIPGWKNMYKLLLPLYPIAFEQFDFSEYDLVISQTTRFAKSIITKPKTFHICYMHTPPRFLWGFSGEKVPRILNPYLSRLKTYDLLSANRVDLFLAGSKNCQQRIKSVYKKDSELLYPFVETDSQNIESFDGGYFLIIARLNSYKRIDIVVEAFNMLGYNRFDKTLPSQGRDVGEDRLKFPTTISDRSGLSLRNQKTTDSQSVEAYKLKVVGKGSELGSLMRKAKSNIEFLGNVSEKLLNYLLSGCKGLIITAEEDFGLTSIEAQSYGKAVIAYGRGGVLETVTAGKTGVFFYKQDKESLVKALEEFAHLNFDQKDCIDNSDRFSKQAFKKRLLELVYNNKKFL